MNERKRSAETKSAGRPVLAANRVHNISFYDIMYTKEAMKSCI